MGTKRCFKCGKEKEKTEFYKHSQMSDGLLGKCKSCTKNDVRGHYHRTRPARARYEKERAQRPERKLKALEYQRKSRASRIEAHKAYMAVSNALRDGIITKPSHCERCQVEDIQAHHEDYSKPLEVIWLCRKHHLALHGKKAYIF